MKCRLHKKFKTSIVRNKIDTLILMYLLERVIHPSLIYPIIHSKPCSFLLRPSATVATKNIGRATNIGRNNMNWHHH